MNQPHGKYTNVTHPHGTYNDVKHLRGRQPVLRGLFPSVTIHEKLDASEPIHTHTHMHPLRDLTANRVELGCVDQSQSLPGTTSDAIRLLPPTRDPRGSLEPCLLCGTARSLAISSWPTTPNPTSQRARPMHPSQAQNVASPDPGTGPLAAGVLPSRQ